MEKGKPCTINNLCNNRQRNDLIFFAYETIFVTKNSMSIIGGGGREHPFKIELLLTCLVSLTKVQTVARNISESTIIQF
jgi:hypothetical protein